MNINKYIIIIFINLIINKKNHKLYLKIINFAYLYDLIGDEVYNWMGVSPSGVKEDTPVFNSDG